MDLSRLLSDDDCQAIAAATSRAESRTSGEIVPYIVGACDDYDDACWKAAAIAGMLAALGAGGLHALGEFWGGSGILWITLPVMVGAAAGYLLARLVAPLRRFLVDREVLELRVHRRALAAFVEEEVFATRDRTGILILVAAFERRAVVIGDAGINQAVAANAWQELIDRLVASIAAGRLGPGMVEAVETCGALLEAHHVEIRPDDTNELPDDVRLRER